MRSFFLAGSALAVLAACSTTEPATEPADTETVAVEEPAAETREVVTTSRDDCD